MPHPDPISPLARDLIEAADYTALVAAPATPDSVTRLLAGVAPAQLLSVPVGSRDAARAMMAGLWLWHDALHESHEISQSLHTPTGSFWHAILHRREGDFWNSKYWYARCRNHPALPAIGVAAAPVLATLSDRALAGRLARGGWDTDAFVDWVEEVAAGSDSSAREYAVKLQQIEWRTLFDYCAREAAGG